jgi:putative DNA primase/helicase
MKGRGGDALPEEFRNVLRLPPRSTAGVDAVDAVDAVPKGLPEAPEFPSDAMPRPCRPLVVGASAAIGCPPEFVALPMLAALAAAIGNSRVVRLKAGWEEGATIYAAVIADPGEKKTPAQKVAMEPAIKLQARLREEYRRAEDEHKRELRQHEVNKRDNAKHGLPADPEPEAPVMERTVAEDVTVERLADLMGETPRGILQTRDELAGWVKAMDQYKSGGKGADRQFYLSAWSNNYVAVDRKNRAEPLMLQRPFVGVFGGIQPEILPELGEGREDGLLDRFLFAYPEPVLSGWTDDEISDEARDGYARLYGKLRDLHMPIDELGDPEPEKIHFSPDAKEVLVQAIDAHRGEMWRPGFPARLKGPWSKLEAYLARLCLVLATSRAVSEGYAERIEAQDVLQAVVLLDYFKAMVRRVHVGLHGENPDMRLAEDVAAFLEHQGGYFKEEPSVFFEQLESDYKPQRADELAKRLAAVSARFPSLHFEKGNFKKDGQSRRCWTLLLKNGVNGVNGVNREKAENGGVS